MTVQKIVKVLLTITILVIPILIVSNTYAAQISFQTLRAQLNAQILRNQTNRFSTVATNAPKSSPTPTPKPSSTPQPTNSTPTNTSSFSEQILSLVNQARSQNNLSPLTIDPQLTKSAQNYAQSMATQNFFSHTAPNGQTMQQRITQAGYNPYRWIAENIAAGQRTPQQVMTTWLNSPGHRANILNSKAQHLGVGYYYQSNSTYKYYWVQQFGAK